MAITLECKNLTKQYGNVSALKDLSLTLSGGKIIGLLGPNGSGKTTLIKLIAGVLQPTSGEVLVNGIAPCTQTKAMVAYLPERTNLPDNIKVSEALEIFKDFYSDFDIEAANSMLADLQIDPQKRFCTLSKGTREKVQLILVMSRNAHVYLLDEPIGGVDPAARDYILNTIIRNYKHDAILIISTHLIGDIENTLDDVIMIKNGTMVLCDNVDNIRTNEGKSIDTLFREVFKC